MKCVSCDAKYLLKSCKFNCLGSTAILQHMRDDITSLKETVKQQGVHVNSLLATAAGQEAQLKTQDALLKSQDVHLKAQDAQLRAHEAHLKAQDAQLKAQEAQLKTLDALLK